MLGQKDRRRIVIAGGLVAVVAVAIGVLVTLQQREQNRVIETSLQPQAIQFDTSDPRLVMIGVTWTEGGWCAGQFHVSATETTAEIKVGTVISRDYPNGNCADLGTSNDMAWASLELAAPVGTRIVVRGSDHAVLPLYVHGGLVRTGPISADIAHFGGLNDSPPLALRKSVRITDPIKLGLLVQELNALPPFPADPMSCPLDDGSYYVIALHYPAGGDATIKADAQGCQALFLSDSKQPAAWAAKAPGFIPLLAGLLGEVPS